jgi:TPR repeat protein
MFELGKLYEFGTGVKRDRQQAYKYVAMAAMQGFEASIGAMASGLPATELIPLRG